MAIHKPLRRPIQMLGFRRRRHPLLPGRFKWPWLPNERTIGLHCSPFSSPSTSVFSSLATPLVSSTVPVAGVCSRGVPQSNTSSLYSSANSFVLAAGGGLMLHGRPFHSLPVIVPSLLATVRLLRRRRPFLAPRNLQNGATRDVADRSVVLTSPLLDHACIVGPGSRLFRLS